MIPLILGLLLFLGAHSVRLVAPAWREAAIARIGTGAWKGLYSLVSLAGLILVVWGYGLARADPILLWAPPSGLKHAASLGVLLAFVLVLAAYVPRNHVRGWAGGHPMFLGTALWAVAHLLASGWLHGVILFAAFGLWAMSGFVLARRRPMLPAASAPSPISTALLLIAAAAAWYVFARQAHVWLMGVSPFG